MGRRAIATFAGAAALALTAAALGAEAKSVRYEIDGQAYTYSTNNREQTEAARQRIKAAEAAAAAKTKAEAELASNPLAKVFGSQAQNEAAEAKARLDEALAGARQDTAVKAGAGPGKRDRKLARAPIRKPVPEPAVASRRDVAPTATASVAATPAKPEPKVREQPLVSPASTGSTAPARAAGSGPDAIVFDLASGIKTTHLPDGTVQEDLFEPGEIARVKAGATPARTRISVVNQPRPGADTEPE
jgi:hypothetical protein